MPRPRRSRAAPADTRFRILALDGGGIRGVLTAVLLERLEQRIPGFLGKVRLFAGTSTGGILALGLASGKTPTELGNLYIENGQAIFDDSWLDDLKDLGGLTGAEYDNTNLEKILQRTFGDLTLGQLEARVLVSSFDLDNDDPDPTRRQWKPKFFHNFPGGDCDAGERVVDVALRTSAAPTKFPSYQGYVDGGVVANNPSMAALAQSLDARSAAPERAALGDLVLLSMGTGTSLQCIEGTSLDWGYAQWVKPLIQIMLQGSVGVADYECRQILGPRYFRLAPVFRDGHVIDDDAVDRVPELITLARAEPIDAAVAWLESQW